MAHEVRELGLEKPDKLFNKIYGELKCILDNM